MNYLPYVGFWFIGAASANARAAAFCSYGLLATAGTPPTGARGISIMSGLNTSIIGG